MISCLLSDEERSEKLVIPKQESFLGRFSLVETVLNLNSWILNLEIITIRRSHLLLGYFG